jgi:hypothetical protein
MVVALFENCRKKLSIAPRFFGDFTAVMVTTVESHSALKVTLRLPRPFLTRIPSTA